MKDNKRKILIAMLTSIGIILGIIENSLIIPLPIPGAKLGLANIIQLVSIFNIGYKESFFIAILRTIVVAIGTGSFSNLIYSLPSAFLSTFVMILIYKFLRNKFSIIGISIIGALTHNLTQVLMGCIILNNIKIMIYYPYMAIISLITGYFTGMAVYFFNKNILSIKEREELK